MTGLGFGGIAPVRAGRVFAEQITERLRLEDMTTRGFVWGRFHRRRPRKLAPADLVGFGDEMESALRRVLWAVVPADAGPMRTEVGLGAIGDILGNLDALETMLMHSDIPAIRAEAQTWVWSWLEVFEEAHTLTELGKRQRLNSADWLPWFRRATGMVKPYTRFLGWALLTDPTLRLQED